MICRLRTTLITALTVLSFSFPNAASAELGYKDLLIGAPTIHILKHCTAIPSESYWREFKCYGLTDVKFRFKALLHNELVDVHYGPSSKTLKNGFDKLIGTNLEHISVKFGTYNLLQNLMGWAGTLLTES